MAKLGSAENPLRVAIVGSGPSGFYAAEALLNADLEVRVDMLERLPAPYGLVRNGVAPDHPKLKQAIDVYDGIARHPRFTFLGNVTVGQDITVAELSDAYHAMIFACGAETDRRLGIPGEDLPGSHTATEFVGWYNGHPDYSEQTFDLSAETVAIIGQGNVAADVCRILAKPAHELEKTDMASHAVSALAESKVRKIYVIGRRGPAQAKFTARELKEIGGLPNCDVRIDPESMVLNAASESELASKGNNASLKTYKIFQTFAEHRQTKAPIEIIFRFYESPVRIVGTDRVEGLVLERNTLVGEPFQQTAEGTGMTRELPCELVFRSIGYRALPIPSVPYDERRGVLPNSAGRVVDDAGPVRGLYAAGWIKRGATGVIGTNRADAVETIQSLLEDMPYLDQASKPGDSRVRSIAARRGARVVSYRDWKQIDASEVSRGSSVGKPREKFVRVPEMLDAIRDDEVA